jgi:hypothetical protein
MNETLATTRATLESNGPLPALVIVRDPGGKVLALRDHVEVDVGTTREALSLRSTRELFRGTRKAPDLARGPTPDLELFFMLLEYTLVRFCEADGRDETDQEMERVYTLLRRRPDSDGGPLYGYLRAAAQLYMSVRDVSEAEYEAVIRRLAKSCRSFSMQPLSRNYLATLRPTFAGMRSE